MALPTFDYIRPTDLAAARDAFTAAGDARYLAGGQTLIPVMKQRLHNLQRSSISVGLQA
jgi:CO/xanthine dehydrogenase FAD-binding subunit